MAQQYRYIHPETKIVCIDHWNGKRSFRLTLIATQPLGIYGNLEEIYPIIMATQTCIITLRALIERYSLEPETNHDGLLAPMQRALSEYEHNMEMYRLSGLSIKFEQE